MSQEVPADCEEVTERMFLMNCLHVTNIRSGSKQTQTHIKKKTPKQTNKQKPGSKRGLLKLEKSRKKETWSPLEIILHGSRAEKGRLECSPICPPQPPWFWCRSQQLPRAPSQTALFIFISYPLKVIIGIINNVLVLGSFGKSKNVPRD